MKNRAKCKLCQSLIESFHRNDYVSCSCGEIAIDGGLDYFKVVAKNYDNFLRVDDQGNEIVIKVKEKDEVKETIDSDDVKPLYTESKLSHADLLKMFEEMGKNIENLPPHAMTMPVNQYDLGSLISILLLIFKSQTKN